MAEDTASSNVAQYLKREVNLADVVAERYKAGQDLLSTLRTRWRKVNNAYYGYIAASQRTKGRSNFHYHKMFQTIEMMTARFALSYFASPPFIAVDPRNGSSVDAAPILEQVMHYYMDHAPNHYLSTIRLLKYTAMMGVAWRVPTWKRETKPMTRRIPALHMGMEIGEDAHTSDEIVYDGLHFETFSPTDVYVDNVIELHNAGWALVETYTTVEKLVEEAKKGKYDLAEVYKIPLNSSGQDSAEYKERARATGLNDPKADNRIVRLQHMFDRDKWVTKANEETIIRERPVPVGYPGLPLVRGTQIVPLDSMYGMGLGEVVLPSQNMHNVLARTQIDQTIMGGWPVWKYVAGRVDPDFLISLPNHAIPVKHMDDVDIIRMPEAKHDIRMLMEMLGINYDEVTGYFSSQKGYSPRPNTATSDSIFQEEGNKRIEFDVTTFERVTLKPEAEQIAWLIQTFMEPGTEIPITGQSAPQFQEYNPQMIEGQFNYKIGGASQSIQRRVAQAQLLELYKLASESMQFVKTPTGELVPVPVLDQYNALKELYRASNHPDVDRILLRPEIFGEPVTNDMLNQFGLPSLPMLDQAGVQPGQEAALGATNGGAGRFNADNIPESRVINVRGGRNKEVKRPDVMAAI